MATQQLYGAAEIEYTPVDGYDPVVHLLAVPLMINPNWGFRLTRRRRRWEGWTADGTEREVFVAGSAVSEIGALIRFENEPSALIELLRAGLEDNVVLTYRPHGLAGSDYDCLLVGIGDVAGGEISLAPDRERFSLGEYEVAVVLRRVDGGTFEGLL